MKAYCDKLSELRTDNDTSFSVSVDFLPFVQPYKKGMHEISFNLDSD